MTPKKLVTIIAIVLIACSATVIALYISTHGFGKAGPQTVRFALTCLMSYWLIRGSSVARWIAIILMGLAGVMSIVAGIMLLPKSPNAIGVIGLGAVYTACAVGLLTPKAKEHFAKPEIVEPPSACDS